MNRCECGGEFQTLEDLEGMFCSKCNKYLDEEESKDMGHPMSSLYSESRARVMRGVPMMYIRIGSETKGRIEIPIPSYATPDESRKLIDTALGYMKYTKDEIDRLELDIYTTRTRGK